MIVSESAGAGRPKAETVPRIMLLIKSECPQQHGGFGEPTGRLRDEAVYEKATSLAARASEPTIGLHQRQPVGDAFVCGHWAGTIGSQRTVIDTISWVLVMTLSVAGIVVQAQTRRS